MKIIIFGASGMVGQALVQHWTSCHDLTLVGRDAEKLRAIFPNQSVIYSWEDINEQLLATHDVVINLVGENIGAKRWSDAQKQEIIESRVTTTAMLAKFCAALGDNAPRLFNASAIGIYGLQQDIHAQKQVVYDEDTSLPVTPNDFLSEVGLAWEQALSVAEEAGVSVVKLRFAVVLSKKGGALAKLLPSFRFGLGSVLGQGQQPMSWVALTDLVAAIDFLLAQPKEKGAFNIVADETISQQGFAKTLASVLKRPCFLPMPAWCVKLLFAQMGDELLLNGQVVKAKRLKQLGFNFRYNQLHAALEHELK